MYHPIILSYPVKIFLSLSRPGATPSSQSLPAATLSADAQKGSVTDSEAVTMSRLRARGLEVALYT